MDQRNVLRHVLGRAAWPVAVAVLTGCAHRAGPTVHSSLVARLSPATQPSADPKADVALDQIEPRITALPAPATRATDKPPPLEALQLYAQARAALVDNQRFNAILLFQRVAALDPDSFDVQRDLGLAYLATTPGNVASQPCIDAFERALAIDPDHLDLQYELGRQYFNRNENEKALERLRLARLTSEYRADRDPDVAIMTDFFLAKALRQGGYTAAALGQYEALLNRLAKPGLSARGHPDLVYFLHHPEIVYAELGELYDKRGMPADALQAYELALKSDPGNVDLAIRVVRLSLSAGQVDAARVRAAALVAQNHASTETVALLKEVYRRLGDAGGAANVLASLHREHPTDRLIFYALLDELKEVGRTDEAERLLTEACRASNADPDYTRRLFDLYQSRNDVKSSMRVLVESLAARPDSLREIGPLWEELLKPARRSRMRLATLQHLQVPPQEEAARLYWVSRIAGVWNRDALARSALQQAATIKPAFPPIYRLLVADYWSRPDWDERQKIDACDQLCRTCEEQGNRSLSAELRGASLMQQGDAAGATKAFAAAIAMGDRSPDLQLAHAKAIEQQGESERAEQSLWRLVGDWPQYEGAYYELVSLYGARGSKEQAIDALGKWLAAVPDSVDARLLVASVYAGNGQPEQAQAMYDALLAEQPANPEVLRAVEASYRRRGKTDAFIAKLEVERQRNPDNRQAVEMLVHLYADQRRTADAARVLDSARAAVANDPDLLYYVAHLYERIQQKQTTERLLEDVVKLDPHHAAASNDLGYTFADEGRNLERAEALVRVAVEEEPDNQSYLDSMAWVEYKRGKFAEARGFLDRAIGPANRPDPVVLDHLGDVMYRLHRPTDAAKLWQRSLKRVEESTTEREDLKPLRASLEQKLRQQEQGKPVDVAPVVENATGGGAGTAAKD